MEIAEHNPKKLDLKERLISWKLYLLILSSSLLWENAVTETKPRVSQKSYAADIASKLSAGPITPNSIKLKIEGLHPVRFPINWHRVIGRPDKSAQVAARALFKKKPYAQGQAFWPLRI